jgi:hypothetical protein
MKHSEGAHPKAVLLEVRNDLAGFAAGDSVGFDDG